MKNSKTKKIVCLSLAAVVAALIVYGAAFICRFIVFADYETRARVDKKTLTVECLGDDMKILILSDLQFANYVEMSWAFSATKRAVKKTNPDLILTTGDNFGNKVTKSI